MKVWRAQNVYNNQPRICIHSVLTWYNNPHRIIKKVKGFPLTFLMWMVVWWWRFPMGDKQEMIPTGIYLHSRTGNLYFVDDVVDWIGKGFQCEIGVSYHRLYEQGRRCVRPLPEFLESQDTGRKNPDGTAKIRGRFILIWRLPPQLLRLLTPENTVYIPERHIIKKVIMIGGVIFVYLIPYHEQGEICMVFAQYLTKISDL